MSSRFRARPRPRRRRRRHFHYNRSLRKLGLTPHQKTGLLQWLLVRSRVFGIQLLDGRKIGGQREIIEYLFYLSNHVFGRNKTRFRLLLISVSAGSLTG